MKMKMLKICENNIVNGTHIIIFMERKKTNHLNFHYCFQFDLVTEMESEYREEIKKSILRVEKQLIKDFLFSPFYSRTPDNKQQKQSN